MKSLSRIFATVGVAFLITACGGGGVEDIVQQVDDAADAAATPDPTATPESITIRGVINDPLPSGAIPSASIPSASLPSTLVPSGSLPTAEVDEFPAVESIRTIEVTLQAQQEVTDVPLVAGNVGLTARATLAVDESTGQLSAQLSAEGLDATDRITMVHIHSGFAGENGPVLVGFDQTTDPLVFELQATLSDLADVLGNDLDTFLAGGWYLNLHTELNPAGQLRGQIFTQDVDVSRMVLEGQQENPAVRNAPEVSGIAYATFNVGAETIVINSAVQGFVPFLDAPVGPVHLHNGFAGENGPVVLPLQPVDGSETVYRGTEADVLPGEELDFAQLAQGANYLNIHSAANPSGELRGQLIGSGIESVRMELQGEQENPPVVNAPDISGVAYATFNVAHERIVVNSTVEGFVPALDAPVGPVHLHTGFAGENGPVVLPLQPVDGSETVFRGTEFDLIDALDFSLLSQGGIYLNVHSAANAGGEVRGQLVPGGVDSVRSVLEGQQENPPVLNADGISGISYTTFDAAAERIVINTTVEGFVPFLDAPVGPVHLHTAFAGENGAVVLPLQPVDGSETVYRGTELDLIAPLDFDQIAAGGTYINVHSAANPSGEVRGQVIPRGIDSARMELQGQQENPAVVNEPGVAGVAYATIDRAAEKIVLTTNVSGFIPFLNAPVGPVHLHSAFAGENGPVILPLWPVDGSETTFRGTEADVLADQTLDFDLLVQGGHYINVHSEANASGEVRGQLVPAEIEVVRMELEGQQENPAIVNTEGVSGVAYATVNVDEERIVLTTSVEGFVPFLNAPVGPVHLHNGFAGENGAVVLPLQAVDGSETAFRGTEADVLPDQILDFERLLQAGTYINVHSAANAGGEVRGQLVTSQNSVLRSVLSGDAALNPITTEASGVGYLTITDVDRGSFLSTVRLSNIDPIAVAINAMSPDGEADNLISELAADAEDAAFFRSEVGPVVNLEGALNGNYTFSADGSGL